EIPDITKHDAIAFKGSGDAARHIGSPVPGVRGRYGGPPQQHEGDSNPIDRDGAPPPLPRKASDGDKCTGDGGAGQEAPQRLLAPATVPEGERTPRAESHHGDG